MVYKFGPIFLSFCHNSRVWRTDGQTDGRTEISSQYRVCITCSAVKKEKKTTVARQRRLLVVDTSQAVVRSCNYTHCA